jgi:REP element-mobilizing transposase RayT
MRRARWISPWKDSLEKPSIYHCISRVVERRFAFGVGEKEKFRMFMRMYENFSGCRVLSYCIMSNHIHLLVEVPPKPEEGIADDVFLKRLSALYSEAFVMDVAAQIHEARHEGGLEGGNPERVEEIKGRFTHRMHDLSQFMKGLMQRFTQWFNGQHKRTGRLWEDRFKSVIVESGTAARVMAAYIDLNPVRAGMVEDPAEYRWSSYGEAVGGGPRGNGKKAREGLVRAMMSDRDVGFDATMWKQASRQYRRLMGMALERKPSNAKIQRSTAIEESKEGRRATHDCPHDESSLPELGMAKILRTRVRYFTDGAVIGSKSFVNEAFDAARERFSENRKDGARKMRGIGKGASGTLWSVRDLRVRV